MESHMKHEEEALRYDSKILEWDFVCVSIVLIKLKVCSLSVCLHIFEKWDIRFPEMFSVFILRKLFFARGWRRQRDLTPDN